jgi:hypothetical protein
MHGSPMPWLRTLLWRGLLSGCLMAIAISVDAGPRRAIQPISPSVILSGHTDGIHALAFFPDGKRLASASHDGTVKLWDVQTGQCLHTFAGHEQAVRAVTVSADGKLIASGSDDRTARVWDVASGAQVAQLEGHAGAVRGVAFLPDGSLLTAGRDGTLRTWDVKTEAPLWVSQHEDCALALGVSADGKRAAYGGCVGVSYVWDLVQKKRLGQFGEACGCNVICVALNPDGSRLYASVGDKLRQPWLVNSVQEVPPPATGLFSKFGLSHDGKRIAHSINDLSEPETGQRTGNLRPFSGSIANCFEFSPDHNVLAAGHGGQGQPSGWVPGRGNLIELYHLPDPEAPVALGSPAGNISWETVPATVRELASGNEVPLAGKDWPCQAAFSSAWGWKTRGAELQLPGEARAAADIFLAPGVVLMQREKGKLRELLSDPAAAYDDLTWDGQLFWVASRHRGIFAFDLEGKIVATIGPSHSLPAATGGICIYALGPDRILVAGASQAGGWCAVIEPDPASTQPARAGGKSYRLKMVFKEAELPDGWRDDFNGTHLGGGPIVTPVFITEPPAPTGSDKFERSIWVVCRGVPRAPQPIVKINPQTLAFTRYNLDTHPREEGKPYSPHRPAVMDWGIAPLWLASDAVIAHGNYSSYFTLRPGDAIIDDAEKSLLCDIGTHETPPPVAFAGRLYLPGRNWFQLNPATRKILRLGPGLRSVDGVALHRDGIYYYASASMNSLAAFSPLDGCVYRISADLTHAGPTRATMDPPAAAAALQPEGRVTFGPDRTSFECGGGLLEFGVDGMRSRPGAGRAIAAVEERLGLSIEEVSRLQGRLIMNSVERERIALTDAQLLQVKTSGPAFTPADSKRLLTLFYAFSNTDSGPAQRTAARPLLDEAAALGQKWGSEADIGLTGFRKIFTDRQWRLLRYEE